jgi:hypothetical protein
LFNEIQDFMEIEPFQGRYTIMFFTVDRAGSIKKAHGLALLPGKAASVHMEADTLFKLRR